ncbi:hypothetical protein NE236_40560 [Actinoallomurus purpureus]|uniref:hypothetical protein n=1 Tax=Actinoallomurus purpureus TaxID=478114 RepID=UPI002093B646|nr:hypothetical protein [Actinoallomurus purpureus]MCO6011261.1 hypothetical protein [Actinoallomurus purpureus]
MRADMPPAETGRVGRSAGVGVKSHTLLRRRLLTLLAGFFGFFMTAVLAAIPGTAVADVIRVGNAESANAAGTGGSAATVAALDRGRGSGHSRAALAGAAHVPRRGAPAPSHVPPAPAHATGTGASVVPGRSATADAIGRPSFAAEVAHPAPATDHVRGERAAASRSPVGDAPAADRSGPGAVTPAAAVDHARASRRVAAVVAAHTRPSPAVFTSAVSLRGPPSHTGS